MRCPCIEWQDESTAPGGIGRIGQPPRNLARLLARKNLDHISDDARCETVVLMAEVGLAVVSLRGCHIRAVDPRHRFGEGGEVPRTPVPQPWSAVHDLGDSQSKVAAGRVSRHATGQLQQGAESVLVRESVIVLIRRHQQSPLESPRFDEVGLGPPDYLDCGPEGERAHRVAPSQAMAAAPGYGLILLPGFASTFIDALRRAAQIAFAYRAADIFCFSWPANGRVNLADYRLDRLDAESSGQAIADALAQFLAKIRSMPAGQRPTIHVGRLLTQKT